MLLTAICKLRALLIAEMIDKGEEGTVASINTVARKLIDTVARKLIDTVARKLIDTVARKLINTVANKSIDTVAENWEYCSSFTVAEHCKRKKIKGRRVDIPEAIDDNMPISVDRASRVSIDRHLTVSIDAHHQRSDSTKDTKVDQSVNYPHLLRLFEGTKTDLQH
ncbi:hypothetical protein DY000_02060559 [Brassica cretica]|uniref:Uncharacterized protein n=1 Tax=Brassica cretica TaxID=69181 RepID=A0ABQ7B0H1_BRACR|nr:hypothetical protein DY000_02060559 [Brassica cretica]